MKKLLVLLTVVIILLIGVNQAVKAQELQDDRLLEILLTRVNAIIEHLFGDMPEGCQWANPLCPVDQACIDNVCIGNVTDTAPAPVDQTTPVIDQTKPVLLISYWDGTSYVPLIEDTAIKLAQSYPLFSISATDNDADTLSCRFYDDTTGALISDGESYPFRNPAVIEPLPMVDQGYDPASPSLADGAYRLEVICEDELGNEGTSGVVSFSWTSVYVPGACSFRTDAIDSTYGPGTWIAVDTDGDGELEGYAYSSASGLLGSCVRGTTIAQTPEGYPVILDSNGQVNVCVQVYERKFSSKRYHETTTEADTSTSPRSPYRENGQEVCDQDTNPALDLSGLDGTESSATVSGTIITGQG
ncbi:MAG: hypothetical protein GXP63_06485 [DPANN group archaeon]|nr:hypothetical protein [DPANN group archaeon]